MPLEFLEAISHKEFPVVVREQAEIDKLRVLRAATLVVADIPDPGISGAAVVLNITQEGYTQLKNGVG